MMIPNVATDMRDEYADNNSLSLSATADVLNKQSTPIKIDEPMNKSLMVHTIKLQVYIEPRCHLKEVQVIPHQQLSLRLLTN